MRSFSSPVMIRRDMVAGSSSGSSWAARAAVEAGELSMEEMDASVEKILAYKAKSGGEPDSGALRRS